MIRAAFALACALLLQILAASTAWAQGELPGNWRVVSLNGQAVASDMEATITVEDGIVSGKAFCNRYTGKIHLSGSTLKVGMLASTRMACPPEVMVQEQVFLAILSAAQTAQETNGSLNLNTGDGRTIGLKRP